MTRRESTIAFRARGRVGGFAYDLAFEADGGVTALLGPSGAGKTTILNLIAGLQPLADGRIRVGGRVLADTGAAIDTPVEARGIGYVFQDGRLFPHLSVAANLRYGMHGHDGADRRDEIVELLDLAALLDRRPATLSGGEERRVAIARALLTRPDLLLLDEPLTGLDPARREAILPYLERVCRQAGVPVIYVTHRLDEVVGLADAAVVVAGGKVIAGGPAAEVFSDRAVTAVLSDVDPGNSFEAVYEGEEQGVGICRAGALRLRTTAAGYDPGSPVRLTVRARDIAIARAQPKDISVLNILPATVAAVSPFGAAEAELTLEVSQDHGPPLRLKSRITRFSAEELSLKPGDAVFALIKAVALARAYAAGTARPGPSSN